MIANEKLSTMLKRPDKTVGSKQVLKGMSEGTTRCVVVADDADAELKTKIVKLAKSAKVNVLRAPSKVWLGHEAGIEVGAAVVGFDTAEAKSE